MVPQILQAVDQVISTIGYAADMDIDADLIGALTDYFELELLNAAGYYEDVPNDYENEFDEITQRLYTIFEEKSYAAI